MKNNPRRRFKTPNWRAFFDVFTRVLEKQDKYTKGHSDRVEHMVELLVQALAKRDHKSWNGYTKQCAELAARFHDLGKIMVAKSTLQNSDGLTDEQTLELRHHPVNGAWMLETVLPIETCLGIRHHHERWDGKGYPDGLAGLDIPAISRVITICDAFDAMTTERPYNVGRVMTTSAAIQQILAQAGIQFDPEYAQVFANEVAPKL
jgi:HD-GYP domain-containing protein (c-di-GMP phosphodiesterase class II)